MSPQIKRGFIRLGLPVFMMFLSASCVTSQRDVLYLNDQIVALNEKVNKLQGVIDSRLSGEVDSRLESVRSTNADLMADLDQIKGEIQRLSGRVEENEHLVKRAVERDTTQQDVVQAGIGDLTQRVAENDARVSQLYSYLGLEPTADLKGQTAAQAQQAAAAASQAAQAPAAAPPAPEKSPEMALYDSSLADYRGGRYEKAIVGFKKFLDEYPKSKLADNAQFWIGESFMSLKQYEQAILAYQQVIKNYPQGNKAPNAMLRQALAFQEIKDQVSCKLLLQKIVKQYPNSSEAEIAKTKLKEIK